MTGLRNVSYRFLCVLPAIALLAATAFAAQESSKTAAQSDPLTVEQKKALEEAERLDKEAVKLRQEQPYAYNEDEGIKGYDKAIKLAERALEIKEKALGPDHPAISATLSNLAMLYRAKKDYVKAQRLQQRALEIKEQKFGSHSPELVSNLGDLSDLYVKTREVEKAESLLERALNIIEKGETTKDPNSLAGIFYAILNIGTAYYDKGEREKAVAHYERVIEIYEKIIGPEDANYTYQLFHIADAFKRGKDYERAEALYKRALVINERKSGSDSPKVLQTIGYLAGNYVKKGELDEALRLFERALGIVEKNLKQKEQFGGPWSVFPVTELGEAYIAKGEHEKTRYLCRRASEIHAKIYDAKTPSFAYKLFGIVRLFEKNADDDEAEALSQRALAVMENVPGSEFSHFIAQAADFYLQKNDFVRAGRLYQRALSIEEKALVPDNAVIVNLLEGLARVYRSLRDERAEPIYLRILSIAENRMNSSSPSSAVSQDALQEYSAAMRDLAFYISQKYKENKIGADKLERLYRAALTVVEKRYPDSLEHFDILMRLVRIDSEKGDHEEANRLFQRVMAITEKLPDSADRWLREYSYSFIESNYPRIGGREVVSQLFDRVLTIIEKRALQDNSSQTLPWMRITRMLQFVLQFVLQFSDKDGTQKTDLLSQRTLSLFEKRAGTDSPEIVLCLVELSKFHRLNNEQEKSDRYYRRASAIMEKSVGSDDLHVESLGALLFESLGRNDYDKTEYFIRRILTIFEKKFGPEDSRTASVIFMLASLYEVIGDPNGAEKHYDRFISILEKAAEQTPLDGNTYSMIRECLHFHSIVFQLKSGGASEKIIQRALAVLNKITAPNRQSSLYALTDIVWLSFNRGDIASAIKYQTRINDALERELRRKLVYGSERDKSLYFKETTEFDFTLSLNNLSAPDNPEARRAALESVLRFKGRALDAMTDNIAVLRRSASDEDKKLLDELSQSQSILSSFTLRSAEGQNSEQHRAQRKALEDRIDELENSISARSAEFQIRLKPVTLDEVQKGVPKGAFLVEFAVYRLYISHRIKFRRDRSIENFEELLKPAPARYAAYLLGNAGEPVSVDLGEAEPIDKAVAALKSALRDRTSDIERDVKPKARALYDLVMKPILKFAGNARRLLLSPDGSLNLIPFDALVDEEGRYLVQQYEISYLTSGPDLLRLPARVDSKQPPLIIADPDFAAGAGPKIDDQAFEPLKRLNSSAEEAGQIKEQFKDAEVLMQSKATKRALKETSRPRILHIATHGFFLEDEKRAAGDTEQQRIAIRRIAGGQLNGLPMAEAEEKTENPLLRSGLFLAGANAKSEDGVLTALEVAGLDLSGTKLVVLSACDTGVGDVKNGDGVYGLRRALVLAGSESQLMSLWPVSDKGTKDLMTGYYEKLKAGEGRSAALRKTQLEMLSNPSRRHPYYWASFIQSGEWANLEGKRQP